MNIALLGFDIEGKASYDYFKDSGDAITICDQNPELEVPDGVSSQLGDNYLDDLDRFDLLVRTPGLHPSKILEKNPGVGHKISTGTNEFFKANPTRNIIGVTGTKGKGTTSTLITRMLEAAGHNVFLGGNIGTPALSFLGHVSENDWVVLELSNFQLIDCQYSPHYAVCLMIVPEHLNWHPDMAEYMQAKSNLFAHQTPEDTTVYYAANNDTVDVSSAGAGQKIPYSVPPGAAIENGVISIAGQTIAQTSELKLLGEHNWQNVCAAITVTWQALHQEMPREDLVAAIRSVVTTFSGLPHRLELVRELDGITYYNDSFSSGLHSTEAALAAIHGPKLVVLGGFERMLPLDHFVDYVTSHPDAFRTALIIGESGPRLADALKAAGIQNLVLDTESQTMSAVVEKVRSIAQPGDAVVFSPGFASYDMFKNFEDRGNQFRDAINNL